MCWTTNEMNRAKVRIAQRDIRVFKVVRKLSNIHESDTEAFPYFNKFSHKFNDETLNEITNNYKIGHTYSTDDFALLQWKDNGWSEIQDAANVSESFDDLIVGANGGFHSYSVRKKLQIVPFEFGYDYAFIRDNKTKMRYVGDNICIMECVIPKGSKYLLNEWGEYVSDCIKVTDLSDSSTHLKNFNYQKIQDNTSIEYELLNEIDRIDNDFINDFINKLKQKHE